jgi:hypothetical protein
MRVLAVGIAVAAITIAACSSSSQPLRVENFELFRAGEDAFASTVAAVSDSFRQPVSQSTRVVWPCNFGLIGGPFDDEASYHASESTQWELVPLDTGLATLSEIRTAWRSQGLRNVQTTESNNNNYWSVSANAPLGDDGFHMLATVEETDGAYGLSIFVITNCYKRHELK